MCLTVYISTPEKLKTSKFTGGETYFYVEKVSDPKFQTRFSFPNVYFLGSHTCCSCGFNYDISNNDNEELRIENQKGRKSLAEMFDFFRSVIDKINIIEMYVCWEGEEQSEPVSSTDITLRDFDLGDEFHFNQREFIRINK
jgi:hypothetical protein